MQRHEAYRALPRKVSQWVLKGLHHNWLSFFESLKAYGEDPSRARAWDHQTLAACLHRPDETAGHQAGTHCPQKRVLRGRGGVRVGMLSYKAALVGIQVEVREESYTSKASSLDLDPIPDYHPDDQERHHFSGKRIGPRSRLYRANGGKVISADVNGAYNILRKSRSDALYRVHQPGFWNYIIPC